MRTPAPCPSTPRRPVSRTTGVAVAAVLLLALAACGDDEPETTPTTPATSATPTPRATTAAPDVPASSAELELAPGRVGPVEVGMTKTEAAATGVFDVDVTSSPDGCEGTRPLVWKKQFQGVDVLTDDSGSVVSLGVSSADGPRTEQDFGVGTTFGQLIEVYGGDLSAPEEAGYGQVGVFVQDGERWLGYLFGEAASIDQLDNDPGLKVTFAEVTEGEKPSLMRDGC